MSTKRPLNWATTSPASPIPCPRPCPTHDTALPAWIPADSPRCSGPGRFADREQQASRRPGMDRPQGRHQQSWPISGNHDGVLPVEDRVEDRLAGQAGWPGFQPEARTSSSYSEPVGRHRVRYDHDHQAVWNLLLGRAVATHKQAIERHLAALCRRRGIPFVRRVGPGRIPRANATTIMAKQAISKVIPPNTAYAHHSPERCRTCRRG